MSKIFPTFSHHLHSLERYVKRYNYLGLVVAIVFFCLSLFPSLLPRSWFFQGLISGAAVAIGYGIGTALSFGIRWSFERDVLVRAKSVAWKTLYVLGPLTIVIFLVLGASWQDQLRKTVEAAPLERPYITFVFILTIVFGLLFLQFGRLIGRLYSWNQKFIDRYIPRRMSVAASIITVALLLSWIVSGAFISFLGTTSSYLFDRKNRSTPEGITQPTETTRSGSKESFIAWDTIGHQGQKFVATGPTQKQLASFSGQPAKEQIRIYAGVNSAPTAYERAELVVKEMHRTKAFDREVIVMAVPTGTGWINEESVDALEYMYGGDTAIVTEQYSFLPSWISFLVDKEKAQDAGKTLYNAVYAEWSNLPEDNRPKLLMYGLSLGSFGGQAAFSGPSNMLNSVDGALWQGTPGDTELWKEIARRRDKGTPEWQPTIDNGEHIRYASQNDDITTNQEYWGKTQRVLYMQHGSDPIVWFNFSDLPLHSPDWLNETRAPDVMPNTRWVPLVTFFQLAADQVVGMSVPKNYGHSYETTVADAWSAIAAPDDWSAAKAKKLQAIINGY